MELIEILKVVVLGIVEGVTEWLPISSTGHMLLVDEFIHMNVSESFKDMFFVVIQLGAILAVVMLFWDKMWPFQTKDKSKPGHPQGCVFHVVQGRRCLHPGRYSYAFV